jgi:hypothetical protein
MRNHRNWIAALAVSILASVGGCSAVDEVTNSVSCGEVCARYSSCDADYDVEGCTDRCESSDTSEDKARRLEACDACFEARSCSDATVSCRDHCVGIVP